MKEKLFLKVEDVCEILGCGRSKAYSVIRQLNSEMKQKGYITVTGRVNAKYFHERIYNGKKP